MFMCVLNFNMFISVGVSSSTSYRGVVNINERSYTYVPN